MRKCDENVVQYHSYSEFNKRVFLNMQDFQAVSSTPFYLHTWLNPLQLKLEEPEERVCIMKAQTQLHKICECGYYNTQLLENTEWHMFHF